MGPVQVATMVQGGAGEPSNRKVHPFFSRPPASETPSDVSTPHATDDTTHMYDAESIDEAARKKRRRTGGAMFDQNVLDPALFQTPEPTPAPTPAAVPVLATPVSMPSEDIIPAVTEPPKSVFGIFKKPSADIAPSSTAAFGVAPSATSGPQPQPTMTAVEPEKPFSQQPAVNHSDSQAFRTPVPAKKILKFNLRTGTLGSPPKPKQGLPRTHIVTIKYNTNDEKRRATGAKIKALLNGEILFPDMVPKSKRKTMKRKDTATPQPEAKQPATTTPKDNKPKPPRLGGNRPVIRPTNNGASQMWLSGSKSQNSSAVSTGWRGTKVPGAMYPMWPAQGMNHVRGFQDVTTKSDAPMFATRSKKSKGHRVAVSPDQSMLTELCARLDIGGIKRAIPRNDDAFQPPPSELRLPTRHFESGRRLRRRIRGQLSSDVPMQGRHVRSESPDELALVQPKPVHPAIAHYWNLLDTQLSAFDRSTCESAAWAQKYAPTTAAQVLQPGKEIHVLKEWLEKLKVLSVESGSLEGRLKSKGDVKKKKRKSNVDDFIVDDDEYDSEEDELMPFNDAGAGSVQSLLLGGRLGSKSRLANTILLSGPHGCGKSAAVYAVAKELGFEIFEINSSTRRSGKDILEKVGDMTRNHLVQQHRAETATNTDEETMNEVKSGKQATMGSFFKANPAAPKKAPLKKVKVEEKPKAPTKAQKQSLILIEEADVLYEEDKQFWASLVSMMSQSKRPFVITCNSEELVPMQMLTLQGIFRLSLPPVEQAVDLCMLIAANEGHALKRSAVTALYKSCGSDLRSTITNLHFWCQLGVGDRRGGFDWFYLRWPKGTDLDDKGDVVRVISEDTYREGMGWMCRDNLVANTPRTAMEERNVSELWETRGLHLMDLQTRDDVSSWAVKPENKSWSGLDAYEAFCETLSDADVYTRGAFAPQSQERVDATLPDMPATARDDFILGERLLDADPVNYLHCDSRLLSTAICSLARQCVFGAAEHYSFPALDEDVTAKTLHASFCREKEEPLRRIDFALAFDPISTAPMAIVTNMLDMSVFDRNTELLVLDVAPWVRSIAIHDEQRLQERMRLTTVLNDGGRKRMRTTRAAYSALEGGDRRTMRGDSHFNGALKTDDVLRTAGEGWAEAANATYEQRLEQHYRVETEIRRMYAAPMPMAIDPMMMPVLGE